MICKNFLDWAQRMHIHEFFPLYRNDPDKHVQKVFLWHAAAFTKTAEW
jgi:hypothetical protein